MRHTHTDPSSVLTGLVEAVAEKISSLATISSKDMAKSKDTTSSNGTVRIKVMTSIRAMVRRKAPTVHGPEARLSQSAVAALAQISECYANFWLI